MPDEERTSSRIPGFFKLSPASRVACVVQSRPLSDSTRAHLEGGGGLTLDIADHLTENVVGIHGLPLSVATNFRVNGRDVLVPMAVEEPSVVAAASNAARMVRSAGGFSAQASRAVMTAQIQLDDVPRPERAQQVVTQAKDELVAIANHAIASVVARGGGCLDLETRVLGDDGLVVVHAYVDVVDAMGANIIDTVAEALAPRLHELLGGSVGLRILSNLPLQRTVKVTAAVDVAELGGVGLADGIVRASRFAERDPFRAVTHNKGIMNGVDAVALATGQDWRSIEAGAHAFAARGGIYAPLATWRRDGDRLVGSLTMPLAVGTVGGCVRAHPGARAALDVMGVETSAELAMVMASAGLASNLAALRALAGEGIQRGHMKLHARKQALVAESTARSGTNGGAR